MENLTEKEIRVGSVVVTMPCHLGMHARVAAQFIRFTRQFSSQIRVRKGKYVADGKSILGLLTLGAPWNSKLKIEVEGKDADKALNEIKKYF